MCWVLALVGALQGRYVMYGETNCTGAHRTYPMRFAEVIDVAWSITGLLTMEVLTCQGLADFDYTWRNCTPFYCCYSLPLGEGDIIRVKHIDIVCHLWPADTFGTSHSRTSYWGKYSGDFPSRPLKSVKIVSLIGHSINRFLDYGGASISMVSAETARSHLDLSSKHSSVKLPCNVKRRTIIAHSVRYRAWKLIFCTGSGSALARSYMKSLIPFERTVKQRTETMLLAPKQ